MPRLVQEVRLNKLLFVGIMRTAPELSPLTLLVDHLNTLLQQWDEERFIQILPDLRFAFSQLNPKQNAELAQYIANDIGLDTQALSPWQSEFSAKQMRLKPLNSIKNCNSV